MNRLSLASLTISRVFIGWFEEKNNNNRLTRRLQLMKERLQCLCSEVGKGLEFEISFQVTNKYLEIADVEGGSFYGTC